MRTAPRFDPDRMRRLREERHLSRAALAALCPNVSMQAVQAYEQHRNKPDIDRALEIATALGVTVHHMTSPGRSRHAATTEEPAAAGAD